MPSITKEDVFSIVKMIPKGKVVTYKYIANILGTKAYRAIGQILKTNIDPIITPCHRVICSSGKIGGYFGNRMYDKIRLLENEGVEIVKEKNYYRVVSSYIMF